MASETIKMPKWGEHCKVYTRRNRKNAPVNKSNSRNVIVSATRPTTNTCTHLDNRINSTVDVAGTTSSPTAGNNNKDKKFNKESDTVPQQRQALPASTEISIHGEQVHATAPNGSVRSNANGTVKPILTRADDRIRINLKGGRPKNEIRDLKSKFVNELDQVRSIIKRLEDEEVLLSGQSTTGGVGGCGAHSRYLMNDVRALTRVHSDVGSVAQYSSIPFRPPSVAIMEDDHEFGELGDNERTPRWKSYGGKKRGRQGGHRSAVYKYISKSFKGCSNLLTRLMKHKHGWVFNKPVDIEALNLRDYHEIIKNPMDLGTIKAKLSKHLYKSPTEFAKDVKLTFNNAMTYNPKGHEVHGMAEELLKIFEAKWSAIESDYNLALRYEMVQDRGLPTPTSRPRDTGLPTPTSRPSASRNLEMPESTVLFPSDPKLKTNGGGGRTSVLKKPKAKDLYKRDMTYGEKQKLSANLQSLPSEKLPDIVHIIKKRNSAVTQHDDEIELDIDSIDAETLWELDRFVSNFKKSVNKKKRKSEIALQAGSGATPSVSTINYVPSIMKSLEHSKIGEKSDAVCTSDQGDGVGRSSSSSSSSSDTGSSSSDSDSDSSSNGSERGRSPRT